MRIAIVTLLALVGCIEGPEIESVLDLTPRGCETGIATAQTFVLDGNFERETIARLSREPPTFTLESVTESIPVETTVGELGVITVRPVAPLPPDTDVELHLRSRNGLGDVRIPDGMFPAPFSTRTATAIRAHVASSGRIQISFSQSLDPASVPGSVVFPSAGLPAAYHASPAHEIEVNAPAGTSPIDITFATTLRTSLGAQVFATDHVLRIDPTFEIAQPAGCLVFQ
jgi:hypothetical protein